MNSTILWGMAVVFVELFALVMALVAANEVLKRWAEGSDDE